MLKSISSLMLLVGMLSSGCTHKGEPVTDIEEPVVEVSTRTTAVHAVVVGMEYSKFAGACPGAALDSGRMYSLLARHANSVILLQNQNATHFAVKDAIQTAIERSGTGLFILYYSGHGGSDPFPDTGMEETDGKDEYLCLYDKYMRDNEIWGMISKAKGRVLLINDCCHSRTMFMSPSISLTSAMPLGATWNEEGPISMQCWSGCPDDTFSYGSDSGGHFTNALLRHYKTDMSYEDLWKKIEADAALRVYERVQRTIMGKDFSGERAFH